MSALPNPGRLHKLCRWQPQCLAEAHRLAAFDRCWPDTPTEASGTLCNILRGVQVMDLALPEEMVSGVEAFRVRLPAQQACLT